MEEERIAAEKAAELKRLQEAAELKAAQDKAKAEKEAKLLADQKYQEELKQKSK